MTKFRTPASIHAAICTICDFIGWDVAAETCRGEGGQPLSSSQIRRYSDPDDVREISAQNGVRLDIAFHKRGGTGFPFSEAIKAKIMRECDIDDNSGDLVSNMVGHLAREVGEAIGVVLDGNTTPREKIKEVADVVGASISLQKKLEGQK